MITEKAKKEFEKWYSFNIYSETSDLFRIGDFYSLPDSMKDGVLVDWFDSVGINISIEPYWCVCKITAETDQEVTFDMMVFSDSQCDCDYSNHATRPQARQKAIEKANEIFNNR